MFFFVVGIFKIEEEEEEEEEEKNWIGRGLEEKKINEKKYEFMLNIYFSIIFSSCFIIYTKNKTNYNINI